MKRRTALQRSTLVILFAFVALLACRDATEPPATVYGSYDAVAQFDGSTATTPFQLGILNHSQGALTATANFAGPNELLTDASLSGREVRFKYVATGITWQFDGTFSRSGESIVGRHTRVTATGTTAGAWTARSGAPPPPF